jgi:transcriptional regulator with XRE-family HTH domain
VIKDVINYGEKIRDLRKSKGWTQKLLSDRINMPQTSVSTWEKIPGPPVEFLYKAHSILTNGQEKFWEFFVEDQNELNDYIPHDIAPIQVEIFRKINHLPEEKRELIQDGLIKILQAALV